MNKSFSEYIEYNNKDEYFLDENDEPLNGEQVEYNDYQNNEITILRFRNGYLDGDIFDSNGNFITQKPAVEKSGHVEYWRENKLHRDNGEPAVFSNNFESKEWWENGKRIK